jgi:hypothetical protein
MREDRKRVFILSVSAAFSLASAGNLSGCVYKLVNSERMSVHQPRTLFINPVNDQTSRGGQAAKLMAALRRQLLQDRSFILTDLETARWGLEVRVTDSNRAITKFEKCDQGNEILASGAVPCNRISGDGDLPNISAEEEISVMSVEATGLDLRTGTVLFRLNLPNLTSGAYNVVGDGTVRGALSSNRNLHVLRYFENSEKAVESLANTAAVRIYEQLVSVPPPSPSL